MVLISELRSHPLFEGLDWDSLLDMEAPFVPNPDDEMDTTYFDGENEDNIIMSPPIEGSYVHICLWICLQDISKTFNEIFSNCQRSFLMVLI